MICYTANPAVASFASPSALVLIALLPYAFDILALVDTVRLVCPVEL